MQTPTTETVDEHSLLPSSDNFTKNVTLILLARMLERAAFYGFQGSIVFYLIGGPLNWDSKDVFDLSSYLSTALIVTFVLGGALGDFVTGHKTGTIAGSILSAAGMLLLCVTEQEGVYAAFGLIALGVGLSTPNLQAHFATILSTKPEKTDAGFAWLLLAANIGGFIGALFMGLLAMENMKLALCICAVANAGAALCLYFTTKFAPLKNAVTNQSFSQDVFVYVLLVGMGIISFFYSEGGFELEVRSICLKEYFADSFWLLQGQMGVLFIGTFTMVFGIIFSIIWSFKKYSSALKFLHGAVLMALSFLLMLVGTLSSNPVVVFVGIALLMGVGDIHLSASLQSLIASQAPKKFLATIYGCITLIGVIVYKIMLLIFPVLSLMKPMTGNLLIISAVLILIVGFGIYKLYMHFNKPAA